MSRNRVFPKTSQYLPRQFPEFYRDEGPNFIAFVQEFYKWKDESSNRNKSRRLLDFGDIDETEEGYLSHFINKYMWSLPRTMVDARFLEKHILDVYRSKGSFEGLRLLFRLLYDKEATVYVPSKDMLAPSAGVFFRAKYIELSPNPDNASLVQTRIRAWESKATALAESYVEMHVRGRPVYVLFISNVEGNFQVGDHIYSNGMSPTNAPEIVGSMVQFKPTRVISGARVGDKYNDVNGYGAIRISAVSSLAGGTIDFNIVNGGFGYTYNATVDVLSGAVLTEDDFYLQTELDEYLDIVTSGTGANFAIESIGNFENIMADVSIIAPYEADTLNSATFLYNETILMESLFAVATEAGGSVIVTNGTGSTLNDDVTISDWESITPIQVGTIQLISTLSPGALYIDDASVIVEDPFVSQLGFTDPNGGVYGFDAVIEGVVTPSKDAATEYTIENSGYGYYRDELIRLKYGNDEFLADDGGDILTTEDRKKLCWGEDDSDQVTGKVILGAVGKQNGYWLDNDGMLNSNKVIQDSFYYQEYSYDINTELPINTYEQAIRNVYHPAGVELFGTAAAYLDNENRSSGTGGILQYSLTGSGGQGMAYGVGTAVVASVGYASGTSVPDAAGRQMGIISGARVYSIGLTIVEGT